MNSKRGAYDVQLTYSGTSQEFMLARDENGGLLYKAGLLPEIVDQQRTDAFSYEHRSPQLDIPAAFERFILGAGFEDAEDTGAAGFAGYNYTQGVDVSTGRGYLAHLVSSAGSALTGSNAKKFILSSLGLFAINDRYVYKWGGSDWTSVLDVGSGGLINDIAEFRNRDGTYLLVGIRTDSYYYSSDGTAWTQLEAATSTPAFRSASTANATATSITPGEPAGATTNDILILAVTSTTLQALSVNDIAFWNYLCQFSDGVTQAYVWWGRRTGSAPDYQVNASASTGLAANVLAFSGCITTESPVEGAHNGTTNASGTSHTVASVTTTGSNRIVVGVVGSHSNTGGTTAPGGTTERADENGTTASVETFTVAAATAGVQGPWTATIPGSVVSGTNSFALKGVAHTGADDISRWAIRGSSTGAPVLWGINSKGTIRSCTDPTLTTSWSTADSLQLGQISPTILGLEVINSVFYLVHAGGITSYDGTNINTVFASPFADPPSDVSRTCIGPDNLLYLTYGSSLLRFDPNDNIITKVWPRGAQGSNAELNGTITAIAPTEKYIYFSIKNSAGNYYVMRMDPQHTESVTGDTIYPAHSVLYRSSNAVNAIAYIKASSSALSSTNPTLMMTSGTTASYNILPRPGLRPEDDSNCRFDTTANRFLLGSYVNFRAQGFPKWLTRGDIEAVTTTTETVALQYQVPAGSATTIVTANTAQSGRTTSAITSPVSFTTVREKVVLNTGANTTTPTLKGTVLHAAPNAPRDTGFTLAVKLKDDQQTNLVAQKSRYKASAQKSFILSAVNQIVTLRDILGDSYTTKMLNAQTVSIRYDGDGTPEEIVEIVLGQLTS